LNSAPPVLSTVSIPHVSAPVGVPQLRIAALPVGQVTVGGVESTTEIV